MKILSIDTSSRICSVSILEDKNLIIEKHNNDEKTHSQKLMPLLDEAFKESNLDDIMDFVGDYDKVEQKSKIDNWLYPIKWKKIERIIIDSIQTNIEEIIKNRKCGLRMLAKRLNMEYKELYQNIENISKKLIKGNKAKVCRDGRVVIMNE